ncbi:hypothetical protein EAWG_01796 [Escherichia coli TA008]|nr:hypothetical protein EAWG_01796 [Escherichia coli TA008]
MRRQTKMNQQSAKREHNAMRFNRKYFEFAAMPE